MCRLTTRVSTLVLGLLAATTLSAQQPLTSAGPTVPRLVRMTGVFAPATGLFAAPVETVTLAIYAEETGGVPLWQETQYVAVDAEGRYAVLLGVTSPDGLPLELFASGDARWLGRRFERPGEGEAARVLLASVPYALKASDADTLGGRPPSAYLLADPAATGTGATSMSAGATSTGAAETTNTASGSNRPLTAGTANYIGKFINTTDLGNSAMYDAGGAVGLGTTAPFDLLHVRFMNTNGTVTGYAVQNLGSTATSYSGMLFYDQNGALGQFQGFNNSTHEYRINNIAPGGSINFMIGSNSKFQVRSDGDVEIPGSLRKGGALFLHNSGSNTFLGLNAGNGTMTGTNNTATGTEALRDTTNGYSNTASGYAALRQNTGGYYNTASGMQALTSNTIGGNNTASGASALSLNSFGQFNTASGSGALYSNTVGNYNTAGGSTALQFNATGNANTADGFSALRSNTEGIENTASGYQALSNNTTGGGNVAVGKSAGNNATTGSNNIYLGANVVGVPGESNTMYLGLSGTQTKTVIAGVRGITTAVADAIPVMIDSAGQLGTVSSSRRFKEDIRDMGDASHALFALRPVTFRYTQAYTDGAKPLQYGLVAEEVAEVFPALAVRNAGGGVDTVHYETLSVLLLNELQKQRQRIELQQQQNELQTQRIETQQERIEALERRLRALLAKPE